MPDAGEVRHQISELTKHLVEVGLADDQNFPIQRDHRAGRTEVTFPGSELTSMALGSSAYGNVYGEMIRERAYNIRMPDGALLQLMYMFLNGELERHRLAFFSAPHLEEFQNNPDVYLEDALYADMVDASIVPFPLRFDFDSRPEVARELEHPKSHLSLGQYQNCRIPVSSPVTPFWFVDFILRNFYHTAFLKYADALPKFDSYFDDCIVGAEAEVVHVRLPAFKK